MDLAHAQCVSMADCEMVWSDEFDGTDLDLNKWEVMLGDGSQFGIPGWGNNELQYYTANNTTVANGVLTITAKEEFASGYNYTSSRLRTLNRGDWKYGRFEMRAKLPTGNGMWPAFWMLSSEPEVYGTWPLSGEIDIMEIIGSTPDLIYGTIHYGNLVPGNVSSGATTSLPAGSANSEFHTYAVEWSFGEIRWYVDDVLYSVKNSWFSAGGPYPAPFDTNFHLLLNLAVGGNFPGPPDGSTVFPNDYVIDYVRVYQPPSGGDGGTGDLVFDDMEHGNPFANGWFIFNGSVGGGILDANSSDLPPENGGSFSVETGWGSGGTAGFYGGFGRTRLLDLTNATTFDFWINPDAGQTYTLEVNLQDDDNADGDFLPADDDEYQFNCDISPSGPCAVAGGGWQKVSIPLEDFFDDGSFAFGGNGVLDPFASANGVLINIVFAVIGSGTDASFRTDYWAFMRDAPVQVGPQIFDDFDDGVITDWGFFGGNNAGGTGNLGSDRPVQGAHYLTTGWGGQGSSSSFYGGFYRNRPNAEQILLGPDAWINMYVLNQSNATVESYNLEVTLREDHDGNGYTEGVDDSVQRIVTYAASEFDDQWRLLSLPLNSFFSLGTGSDGVLSGAVDELVLVIAGVQGGANTSVEVDFDLITFTFGGPRLDMDVDGVEDAQDNCTVVANPAQTDTDLDGIGNACDADFDQSCLVDFADLAVMKNEFFGPGVSDMDANGTVDFLDLALFKLSIFAAPGPSGVPNLCDPLDPPLSP